MRALLASAPILTVLVLMVGARWSAVRAGVLAAAGTLVLAVSAFDLGDAEDPFGPLGALGGVAAEAAFVTATVVAIIGPALAVHHLQQRTGATEVLRSGLARLLPDPRLAALLIAWFFSLFLEGAAGFGTPVALAAPFLVAAGFTPVAAVTVALVGHAAGVSFGALGTPVLAQVAATDFTGLELARATVPYHAVLGWLLAGAVAVIVGRSLPGKATPWGWAALAAACFLVPYWLLGRFVGPELPTLGGAALGALAFVAAARRASRRASRGAAVRPAPGEPSPRSATPTGEHAAHSADDGLLSEAAPPATTAGEVVRATAPYLALIALVLVTRLVPPVRDALEAVVVEWELLGTFSGSVRPLYHPGALLPLALGLGALAQRASRADLRAAVTTTNRQLAPVVVALVAMVAIARTMSHAGMTHELAAAAAGAGGAWPLLAPAIGALGTFVTGSATASNILFTELQESTATSIGRAPLPLLGAQGFGAAVGNIVCPHNVVAAAATVGLSGQEGTVLRRTLPIALAYVALGGLLAWLAFT